MFFKKKKETDVDVLQKIKEKIAEDTTANVSSEGADELDALLSEAEQDNGGEDKAVEMNNEEQNVLDDINQVVEQSIAENDSEKQDFEGSLESDFLADVLADTETDLEEGKVEDAGGDIGAVDSDNNDGEDDVLADEEVFAKDADITKDENVANDENVADNIDDDLLDDATQESEGKNEVAEDDVLNDDFENFGSFNEEEGTGNQQQVDEDATDEVDKELSDLAESGTSVDDDILDTDNNEESVAETDLEDDTQEVYTESTDGDNISYDNIDDDALEDAQQEMEVLENDKNGDDASLLDENVSDFPVVPNKQKVANNNKAKMASRLVSTQVNSGEIRVSKKTQEGVKESITDLIENVKNQVLSKKTTNNPRVADFGSKTVEQIVVDVITPMLEKYLDANLDKIVRQAVDEEIKKIVNEVAER